MNISSLNVNITVMLNTLKVIEEVMKLLNNRILRYICAVHYYYYASTLTVVSCAAKESRINTHNHNNATTVRIIHITMELVNTLTKTYLPY